MNTFVPFNIPFGSKSSPRDIIFELDISKPYNISFTTYEGYRSTINGFWKNSADPLDSMKYYFFETPQELENIIETHKFNQQFNNHLTDEDLSISVKE